MELVIKGRLKSQELTEKISDLIVRNRLKPGDPILSENRLAEKFKLSRITVRQAIANLVEQGVLFKKKGKGTFVAKLDNLGGQASSPNVFSQTIALVATSISDSFFANIARGAEDAARKRDFHISFYSTDNHPVVEEKALRQLIDDGVGGIILSPVESNPLPSFLQNICLEFDNLVVVNNISPSLDSDMVSSDDVKGGYLATRHLLELGHRKIAHLRGPSLAISAQARENGYRQALDLFGAPQNEKLIRGDNSYSEDSARINLLEIMRLPENERPTAVFAANDDMAVGAFRAAAELGLSVPEDLAIIGFGNLAEPAQRGYSLSTINQNPYEIGLRSCDLLLERVINPSLTPGNRRTVLTSPELIVRNSSLIIKEGT